MDNGSGGVLTKAFEWCGAFVSGVIGIRWYHSARIKSDSQEFRELKADVRALQRRQGDVDVLLSTVEDHEKRLIDMQKQAARDRSEIMRRFDRQDEKLDRLLDDADR